MNTTDVCILCGRECATHDTLDPDAKTYECSSCGPFGVVFPADQTLQGISQDCRLRVAACVRERSTHGLSKMWLFSDEPTGNAPDGSCSIYYLLDTVFPSRIQDRFDRALRNLCRLTAAPGKVISINAVDDLPLLFAESPETAHFTLKELENLNYITLGPKGGHGEQRRSVTVTAPGIARMQQLEDAEGRNSSLQAFIAMWFDSALDSVFREGIEPAVRDCGFKALRIDAKETNHKICDEIIAEIRRSRFLIADFTGNRGGAYFEAGFALGLGIPVIWMCRNTADDIGKLHFDTRQYSHVIWGDAGDLRKKLRLRIAATIPGAKRTWTNE